MNKNAFTLAETLIVLVIIGVVAAITIPATVTRANNEQLTAGAKKSYNTIKTAVKTAEQEYGPKASWILGPDAAGAVNTYLKPYLDILKDCESDSGCFEESFTDFSGEPYDGFEDAYKFMTVDGMSWGYVHSSTPVSRLLYVDVNGPKKPNKLGRDVFIFSMGGTRNIGDRSESLIGEPYGINATDDCTSTGKTCLIKIIKEGKMNY